MTDHHRQAAADAIFKLLAQNTEFDERILVPKEALKRILEILDNSKLKLVWSINEDGLPENIDEESYFDPADFRQLDLW